MSAVSQAHAPGAWTPPAGSPQARALAYAAARPLLGIGAPLLAVLLATASILHYASSYDRVLAFLRH